MSVSHSPAGFTGTVDEIGETKRFGLMSPPFRVASVTDWAPSADAGINRTVDVTAGTAAAYGVADTTTAADSVAFAVNNGASNRYDALVATWTWASGLSQAQHSVVFRVIQGSTTPPTVNSGPAIDNTKINRVRGVQYDALVAVVRVRPSVGIFSSGDVVDCRMWAGYEGYANTGSAQYLTLLDAQPGSLVHDVSTNIVWSRNLGGVWGFEKWIGTDKTKQPMMSVRNLTAGAVGNNVVVTVGWADVTDHSGGGFTFASGNQITCNWYGRVRIEGFAFSDAAVDGVSFIQVSYPAGGGNYFTSLSDERQRNGATGGYGAAGTLRQVVGPATLQVAPGDVFNMQVQQVNSASSTLTYQFSMTATYV